MAVVVAAHGWLLADGPTDPHPRRWADGPAPAPASRVHRITLVTAAAPAADRSPARRGAADAAGPPGPPMSIATRAATGGRAAADPGSTQRVPAGDALRTEALDATRTAAAPPLDAASRTDVAGPRPAITAAEPAVAGTGGPPLYRTRLPASFERHYEAQRPGAAGRAVLRFEAGDDGYRLELVLPASGRDEPGLASRGRIAAHGLAPERFTTRVRGRDRQAASFEHDRARIRYSGPDTEHELLPGAQDRLSWLVQLPAIVDADPATYGIGAQVRMQVSGARGEAAVWTFFVVDRPAGDAPGHGDLLHLVREPARPYDTRAEVWLAPGRQHLPVRVRLSYPPGAGALELRLADSSGPPP